MLCFSLVWNCGLVWCVLCFGLMLSCVLVWCVQLRFGLVCAVVLFWSYVWICVSVVAFSCRPHVWSHVFIFI